MLPVMDISVQTTSISAYSGFYALEVSLLIGKVLGLLLSYLLKKCYVFSIKWNNILHDGKLFMLYSLMGIFITVIVWGVKYIFYLIFTSGMIRNVGKVIGLAIGFYLKYQLNKKFVFLVVKSK